MSDVAQKFSGEQASAAMARPWGIREKLEHQRQDLTARLDRVNAALAALDSQPGVADALEAVFKAL